MPSEERTAREAQKRDNEKALAQRIAILKERGLDDDAMRKDSRLRHLRAELRRTNRRLSRISQIENQNATLASRKGLLQESE